MGPLMTAVASDQNLARAWETVRDNDLRDGVLSPGVDRFARQATRSLTELAAELRDDGWEPSPLTRVMIDKPDGGRRRLGIPAVRDRIVERAIGQVITPVIDPWFSPWSFAYRPGIGVADAVRALVKLREAGGRWVVRADFRDCFDRLRRDLLLDELARYIRQPDEDLLHMVARLLHRPERVGGRLVEVTVGATQGGPLSPILCNLLLTRFDDAMLGRGWPGIRYADDLTIVTTNRDEALAALSITNEEASRVAMDLADDKTEVVSFEEGFAFLGEDVNHRYPEDLPPALRPVPDRRTLYVGRQGSTVRLRRGQLSVTDRQTELLTIPSGLVGQIVTFGSVLVTPAVLAHASHHGWSIVWMSRKGWLHGWLDGPSPARSDLRRKQYRMTGDDELRLDLARRVVLGKVANQRSLLARYARRDAIPRVVGAVALLGAARDEVLDVSSLESLLGIEGAAARTYFEALGELMPEWAHFDGRTRQPPTDPANSLLSFLYTVLSGQVVGAVLTAGLDPAAGFLHGDNARRPSLALDVMEEFRPVLVDTLCLELFRRGTVKPEQFSKDERDGAVSMTSRCRAKVLAAFEERMLTVFAHVPSGRRVSYRRALFLQAQQVATCVRRGEVDYTPISWR